MKVVNTLTVYIIYTQQRLPKQHSINDSSKHMLAGFHQHYYSVLKSLQLYDQRLFIDVLFGSERPMRLYINFKCLAVAALDVRIRPKKSSVHTPERLRSHLDTNNALRRLVTSIRDADLDLIGDDRDTRRKSQLRKSLAHHTFNRKNSTNNRRVFMLRAKERQKQVSVEYQVKSRL